MKTRGKSVRIFRTPTYDKNLPENFRYEIKNVGDSLRLARG